MSSPSDFLPLLFPGYQCYLFSILSFKVFCEGTRDYNSSFKTSQKVVEAVSARRSVVRKDELKPGTKYTVYVKATTVKGDGVGSDPVIVHTPSKGIHEELDLILRECNEFLYQCLSLEQLKCC